MALSEEQRDAIADALKDRGAAAACSQCGGEDFSVADGYSIIAMHGDLGAVEAGGPTVPAAVVVCGHCGNITQHALGALGLLPE